MTITENITARENVRELEQFIRDCYDTPPRFWELLAEYCASQLPPKPAPVEPYPAMNEQEAIHFENVPLPYGKHSGVPVGEVVCDYIIFLTEGDEFSKRLKRYVKSQRFQERQGEE